MRINIDANAIMPDIADLKIEFVDVGNTSSAVNDAISFLAVFITFMFIDDTQSTVGTLDFVYSD